MADELVFVALGYKLAMYPLIFGAFIYSLMVSAIVFPAKGVLADFAVGVALAVSCWIVIEIYKAVQVENLRKKIKI